MLHLFDHAVLLGCVRRILLFAFMLHLLCGETFNYLVDDGGCIYLVVIAEGIGRDCRLTAFDVALCLFEVILERRPGFFSCFFSVPFSDVACEECGTCYDDESDVDQLGRRFCRVGRVGHVSVFVDRGENVSDGLGMIVRSYLECGFGGG